MDFPNRRLRPFADLPVAIHLFLKSSVERLAVQRRRPYVKVDSSTAGAARRSRFI